MLKLFQTTYLFFHHLSLDVVSGAVGGYAFACRVLGQEVSPALSAIVGLAVWITYLSDHLLDSLKAGGLPVSKYRLFSKNRRFFLMLLAFLCLAEVLLVLTYVEQRFIIVGLLTGLGVLVYLVVQHFLKGRMRHFFPKEILISVIYTAALWSFPLMQATNYPDSLYGYIAVHFLLVVTNVLLFSFFEQYEDMGNEKISVFTRLDKWSFRAIIMGLCGACFWVATGTMLTSGRILFMLPVVAIALWYVFEIMFYHRLGSENRYAPLTDGAFLLYLIYLL